MKAKRKRPPAPPVFIPAKPAVKPPRRQILAALGLSTLALLAFSSSFATGFALDNQVLLLGDPRIRQATAHNLGQILQHTYWWPNGEAGIYRPLTTLSHPFNYVILGNGGNSAGYHWTNLLLHAVNVLLVYTLAGRLFSGHVRRSRLSFFVAALWAVHPALTESVTNIAGRADLLAAMAVLGGFLMYLKSARASGWRRIGWLAGLAAATAAGAWSKESAVVLPGVIILYELSYWKERRKDGLSMRPLLWGVIATALPLALTLWQRSAVLAAAPPAEFPFVDNPIVGADFLTGRLTAIKVLAHYLWLALWPVKLSSDYSYAQIPLARGGPGDWIACVAGAGVLAVVAIRYRHNRLAFFLAGFAFLNLLPTSNLLFPIGTIMAERFLYLPLVGFVACLVLAIDHAAAGISTNVRGGNLAPVLCCLIATGFGVRTWLRNRDWTNDLSMATATVQTSPDSFKAHRLLAAALFQSDRANSNIDRVIAESDKCLAILGALPDELLVSSPWNQAAAYRLAKGDSLQGVGRDRSDAQFQQAARLALRSISIETASRAAYDRAHGTRIAVPPTAAEAYRILASAYLRLRQAEQALPAAMQARAIDPSSTEAYAEIADAYLALARAEDAAMALAEGMFTTGDMSLRTDLLKLYQSGVDTKGCAVVPGSRGPALNPNCEMVHADLCAGAARAHRQDLLTQLACPKNP
jgi:protein O-mannosyl-transferase